MTSSSPYITLNRSQWARLRDQFNLSLSAEQFHCLIGLNENISINEVEEVYLPLTELIHIRVEAAQRLHKETSNFLHQTPAHVPYIIGIAGSVAAGKSTTARLLQALLSQCPEHPHVQIVTTDGFLYPNRELERRGIMNKKGFPQSYNTKKLLRFLKDVKSGCDEVLAPVYSHFVYDIVPDESIVVRRPDILILEGINVLQVSKEASTFVSDFFDYSIYVDAKVKDLEQWYLERFLMLRHTAFQDPDSYFHRYAALSERDAIDTARRIWKEINELNLMENILPTRGRAQLILNKGNDHRVGSVQLRK